jgi:hypothetical protein
MGTFIGVSVLWSGPPSGASRKLSLVDGHLMLYLPQVDEVVENAPWVINQEFLDEHKVSSWTLGLAMMELKTPIRTRNPSCDLSLD